MMSPNSFKAPPGSLLRPRRNRPRQTPMAMMSPTSSPAVPRIPSAATVLTCPCLILREAIPSRSIPLSMQDPSTVAKTAKKLSAMALRQIFPPSALRRRPVVMLIMVTITSGISMVRKLLEPTMPPTAWRITRPSPAHGHLPAKSRTISVTQTLTNRPLYPLAATSSRFFPNSLRERSLVTRLPTSFVRAAMWRQSPAAQMLLAAMITSPISGMSAKTEAKTIRPFPMPRRKSSNPRHTRVSWVLLSLYAWPKIRSAVPRCRPLKVATPWWYGTTRL